MESHPSSRGMMMTDRDFENELFSRLGRLLFLAGALAPAALLLWWFERN